MKNAARLPARRFVSIVTTVTSARGAQIDLAFGQGGQLFVGRLFLVQRLLQNAGFVVVAGAPFRRGCAELPGLWMFVNRRDGTTSANHRGWNIRHRHLYGKGSLPRERSETASESRDLRHICGV
jgi:hypothetical protein